MIPPPAGGDPAMRRAFDVMDSKADSEVARGGRRPRRSGAAGPATPQAWHQQVVG
jgi:hypothetical protein